MFFLSKNKHHRSFAKSQLYTDIFLKNKKLYTCRTTKCIKIIFLFSFRRKDLSGHNKYYTPQYARCVYGFSVAFINRNERKAKPRAQIRVRGFAPEKFSQSLEERKYACKAIIVFPSLISPLSSIRLTVSSGRNSAVRNSPSSGWAEVCVPTSAR